MGQPDDIILPGSLLHIDVPATIGVDPGSTWTGICARIGGDALDAACIGFEPGRTFSDAERTAASAPAPDDPKARRKVRGDLDIDNFAAWRDYHLRVYEAIEAMWDEHFPDGCLVVFEEFTVPQRPTMHTQRRIPLIDWTVPRELNAGIAGRFPGAVGVVKDDVGFGDRHQKGRGGLGDVTRYYPNELYRKRPVGWSRNDHPKNARNHERAAYDVAGAAHVLLNAAVSA